MAHSSPTSEGSLGDLKPKQCNAYALGADPRKSLTSVNYVAVTVLNSVLRGAEPLRLYIAAGAYDAVEMVAERTTIALNGYVAACMRAQIRAVNGQARSDYLIMLGLPRRGEYLSLHCTCDAIVVWWIAGIFFYRVRIQRKGPWCQRSRHVPGRRAFAWFESISREFRYRLDGR